jgi:single-stranded-DNA-specific exonuclease
MITRWLDPHPVKISASFSELNLSPLIAQTLVRRGISDAETARAFLHPDTIPSTPFPNIEEAVECIIMAMRRKDPVCVWGDFDADGQTSTALLVQTLQTIGANVTYYIPIRGKESHGVHIESLKPIIDNGVKLIITCDTGITAYEAINYANARGVDVIVTDHHDLGESLPDAKAIINPKLLAKDHPLANLAGVGVAYKLAEAILEKREAILDIRYSRLDIRDSILDTREAGSGSGESELIEPEALLDLVALGLIADVALLKGETRALAQKGIKALRNTQRAGLKAIAELSGTNLETSNEETIGFTFAPRLNALGRLSDANPAVELLLTQDEIRARILAAQIEGLNSQRQLLTSQVYEAAESQLRGNPALLTEPAILLTHRDWPGGVVGIVANKLAEKYHKPAILLTESDDGLLRGSARSIEGLHITEAIAANKDLLINFGGHPMAAGLSLPADQFKAFKKGFGKAVEKQLGEIVLEEPTLQIDAWLGLNEINFELANSLESLAPFGAGNPELTLATRNLTLKSVKEIGHTKEHRRLILTDDNGVAKDFLWWNGAGEEIPDPETKIDVAYSLRAGTYRGKKQLTLQFHEFRAVEEKPIEVREQRLEIRDWRIENGEWRAGEKGMGEEGRGEGRVLDKLPEGVLIWAEGKEKNKGKTRFQLRQANDFAILTTPPSPAELQAALEIVEPKIIYVVGRSPQPEKTDEFLARLAGMAKFAIHQRGGKVRVRELAAATAQREVTIRMGLEWLGAGGHIQAEKQADEMILSEGNGSPNPYLQRELYTAIKGLLEETAAYRDYFSKAKAEALFKF